MPQCQYNFFQYKYNIDSVSILSLGCVSNAEFYFQCQNFTVTVLAPQRSTFSQRLKIAPLNAAGGPSFLWPFSYTTPFLSVHLHQYSAVKLLLIYCITLFIQFTFTFLHIFPYFDSTSYFLHIYISAFSVHLLCIYYHYFIVVFTWLLPLCIDYSDFD